MNNIRNDEQISKPTILIVEDHEGVRTLLREWLTDTFPGCRFLEAKSGEEAVTLAQAQTPDIILMDIGLPRMDGIQATRCIKAAMSQVRVVMLTSYDDPVHKADAAAAKASAYVLKSKMDTELIIVLSTMLSHSGRHIPR